MLSCRTQHTYTVEMQCVMEICYLVQQDMTRECYNVWIDTNNDMSEIDMMMCEPS